MTDTIFTDALLASLADSTEPVATARALPAEVYTSDEFLAFEKDALFAHEWLCVGRSERIPEPGDWFTVVIADEPLIVVRGKDGTVNCVSGVCQHRAMQVCEGSGNATTFTCPYHHWTYALDGRLLKCAYLGSFQELTIATTIGEIFVVSPDVQRQWTIGETMSLRLSGNGVSVVESA